MKKILFILSILSFSSLSAQITFDEVTSNLNINTPEVASLETYAISPVSLARGNVNLSIPITGVKGVDLSHSVSLSYRAGVKIHNASEFSGHGWSLMAGGVISRSVVGEVDPFTRYDFDGTTYTSEQDFIDILGHQKDAAPDVFSYNFNGLSGQFILKEDLVTPYYIKTQRDWIITVNNTKIEVLVENGTKYVFDEIITNSIEQEGGLYYDDNVTTSWYLTEIISVKNDEKIEISYFGATAVFERAKNNRLHIDPAINTANKSEINLPNMNYNAKRVDQISLFSNNQLVSKVKIEATTPRQDLLNTSYALSRISVYDRNATTPVKYFEFNIENVNQERIFLQSIQEFSGDGLVSKPAYEFEYINKSALPDRLEYKADLWGYYSQQNGAEFPYDSQFPWLNNPSRLPSSTAEYGSLRKITFPTGGYKIFEYGLNEYQDGSVIRNAGGIRIEKQIIGDPQTGFERTINYIYKISDANLNLTNNSSGQITEKPITTLYSPSYKSVNGFGELVDKYSMKSMTKHIENSWVNYTEVRIEEQGKGFEIHKFYGLDIGGGFPPTDRFVNTFESLIESFNAGSLPLPLGVNPSYLYNNRWPFDGTFITNALLNKPSSTSTYRNDGNNTPILVSKEEFDYYRYTQDRFIRGQAHTSGGQGYQRMFVLNFTEYDREYSLLKSSKKTIFGHDGNNPLIVETEYEYNPSKNHYLPIKVSTSNSLEGEVIKKYKYSKDYSNDNFGYTSSINTSDLKDRNIFGPIEEQVWESQIDFSGKQLIASNLYIYDKISSNDLYQPIKILKFENPTLYSGSFYSFELNKYAYSSIDWHTGIYPNVTYDIKQEIAYYDSGTIKHVSKKDGTLTYFLWGYNDSRIIAKIENATETEVTAAIASLNSSYNTLQKIQSISNSESDRTFGNTGAEGNLRTALNSLRSALPNSMVTTYTYDPLIGITSITDQRAETMYYHYDSLLRLEYVKDSEGKILSANQYQYKN
jgi:hypothetical protein